MLAMTDETGYVWAASEDFGKCSTSTRALNSAATYRSTKVMNDQSYTKALGETDRILFEDGRCKARGVGGDVVGVKEQVKEAPTAGQPPVFIPSPPSRLQGALGVARRPGR
jgi:hypothetical protein